MMNNLFKCICLRKSTLKQKSSSNNYSSSCRSKQKSLSNNYSSSCRSKQKSSSNDYSSSSRSNDSTSSSRSSSSDSSSDSSMNDFTTFYSIFEANLDKVTKTIEFKNPNLSISLCVSNADKGLIQSGCFLWPASYKLSEYLLDNFIDLPLHGNIIELGCGTALSSIVLAKMIKNIKKKIYVTDRDTMVLDMAYNNAKINNCQNIIYPICIKWGKNNNISKKFINDNISLIIAADCLYNIDIVEPFLKTCQQLLMNNNETSNDESSNENLNETSNDKPTNDSLLIYLQLDMKLLKKL